MGFYSLALAWKHKSSGPGLQGPGGVTVRTQQAYVSRGGKVVPSAVAQGRLSEGGWPVQATLHPALTVPSGSTSSRCLAWPLCMPVRTKEPGLVVLFLTRKSPSLFSSPSASFLLISPWYQGSAFSSSSILASGALGEMGLMHSTEAALLNTGPKDWFLRASSKGSANNICQQHVNPKENKW